MKRIQTYVKGRWRVSTALVGGIDRYPYETAVLDSRDPAPDWRMVAHYMTPDAARRGHNRIVNQLKGGDEPHYI